MNILNSWRMYENAENKTVFFINSFTIFKIKALFYNQQQIVSTKINKTIGYLIIVIHICHEKWVFFFLLVAFFNTVYELDPWPTSNTKHDWLLHLMANMNDYLHKNQHKHEKLITQSKSPNNFLIYKPVMHLILILILYKERYNLESRRISNSSYCTVQYSRLN